MIRQSRAHSPLEDGWSEVYNEVAQFRCRGVSYRDAASREAESFFGGVLRAGEGLFPGYPPPGLRANRFDALHFAIGGAEAVGRAHGLDHRVVDVEAFGADVEDLARLEAAIGSGDGVENAR